MRCRGQSENERTTGGVENQKGKKEKYEKMEERKLDERRRYY